MGSKAGPLLDAARASQNPQRDSADVPALKIEYDDEAANNGSHNRSQPASMTPLTQQTQPPSPLYSLSPGVDAHADADLNLASFAANSFLPDDDVPMTDATNSTTTATATTATERPPFKPDPSPSATTTPAKKPRMGGARSRGGGASRRRGGSSASRGGGGRSRGGGRGGGSNGLKSGGRGGSRKLSALSNGGNLKTGGSPAPGIKREAGTTPSLASDDDQQGGSEEEEGEDDDDSSDNGPYCICRGPDDHRWMIQCDQCEDWFHGDCVKIDKELGESVILSYICPACAIPERYITRFRKLCSFPSCRRPARLYAEDNVSPASPDVASYFCSDGHRDQWWDALLARIGQRKEGSGAIPEDKMPIDQLTSVQLVSVLASSYQEGVAQMLLHGLTQDKNVDPESLLTGEERAVTQTSTAQRRRLAEQYGMCKKMLELLDMAKFRNYEAIKAGLIERDCCGYDDRLEHVGVQPHFEQFLASPEGAAIFQAGRLTAPLAHPGENDDGDGASDSPAGYEAATAGMCRKRKCKAHLGWFPTLARDVRMQIQDLTREAAAQRDIETRIRCAAMQRAFVKRHMRSEVLFVGDSDNSLSSLGGDSDKSDSEATDEDDNKPAKQPDELSSASPPFDGYVGSYRSSVEENAPPRNDSSPGSIGAYSD